MRTPTRSGFHVGLLALTMTTGVAAPAHAQAVVVSTSGGASLVTGIGHRDRAFPFGGGVEIGSGPLRLGGEIGVVYLPEKTTTFRTDYEFGGGKMPAFTTGAFAFRASYYPDRFAGRRLQPFVTGGLSVYPAGSEPFATLDGGGGLDWWSTRHVGVRIEIREQYGSFTTVRVGVVLR